MLAALAASAAQALGILFLNSDSGHLGKKSHSQAGEPAAHIVRPFARIED